MTPTHPTRLAVGLICVLACLPAPLQAAIPPAVEAMLREAAKGGDEATLAAVAKVAKATNPDDADAIGALAKTLLATQKAGAEQARVARLKSRHFLEGWAGEGQLGIGLSSGNTRETSAVLGLKLRRDGLHVSQKLTGVVDYLRTNGVTTRQKYALDYAINVAMSEKVYAVGTFGWERDTFAGYARRFTESLGVGYRALDTDRMHLELEAGPALRQSRFSPNAGFATDASKEEWAGRASLALRWKMMDTLSLTQNASILSGSDDTTLNADTALTAKLNGRLSGRLSLNVQNETNPPDGRKSTDTVTRATLVYAF